jgi:hypothetical protein
LFYAGRLGSAVIFLLMRSLPASSEENSVALKSARSL